MSIGFQQNNSRSRVQFLTVSSEVEGQRLDNYLISNLKGVPKTLIYKIIRKGEVRINKGRVKAHQRVQAGDTVRIPPLRLADPRHIPKPSESLIELLQQSILYEDDALLAVNKPSGLAVHGGSGVNLGLIEALRQTYPSHQYLELVHRLDRETSGCILIAKKRSALKTMQEAFRESKVNKHYLALVAGTWPKDLTCVDKALKKNILQSGERMVRVDNNGKASKTRFRVVEAYENMSLIQASPITGRTHQIRVHALSAGHPLIGDEKYGEQRVNQEAKRLGIKRLCLHASSLEIPSLDNSEHRLRIDAALPEDLEQVFKKLKHLEVD